MLLPLQAQLQDLQPSGGLGTTPSNTIDPTVTRLLQRARMDLAGNSPSPMNKIFGESVDECVFDTAAGFPADKVLHMLFEPCDGFQV